MKSESAQGNSFTILGSSSGEPNPTRSCSGYVLQVGESLTLIDCGGGVSSSFLRSGFDPRAVKRVFISHSHPDHVCDLPLFIQMIHLSRRTNPLDIYLPEEFVVPFQITMRAMYLIPERFAFPLSIYGYEDGFEFKDSIHLRAIGNSHLKRLAYDIQRLGLANKMQCCSFKIDVGDKSVFYSADIGEFSDVSRHLDGCDYVVMELTHVDLDEFFVFAPNLTDTRFVITHLSEDSGTEEIVERARAEGISNLVIAEDGMRLPL